ncbi:alpha/beta hydrolase [Pseudomonas sp. TYF_14]|uniref:alpha/beta hydrolase n=1 Tax=Pseudomonas sp. TYF_14 TaxID=3367193 RepID=UPI00370A0E1B
MSNACMMKNIAFCALALISFQVMAQTYEYRDLPKDQLDNAYNQAVWAPNFKETIAGYHDASVEVRKLYQPRTFAYGEAVKEKLDVYAPKQAKDLPIMLFIHGGAWKSGSKDDSAGPVKTFVDAGVIYVAVGFDLIPDTDLSGMVDQVRRAVIWVNKNAKAFGGDPDKIYISGHSSGGHLAAVLLTTEWNALGAPRHILKGGVVISGMGDLHPPMQSARGSYLKLSNQQIQQLSPINHMAQADAPVLIAWGANESPEFIRQGKQLASAFEKKGRLYWEHEFPATDHFVMVNLLNDPDSELSKKTLELVKTH